ncbi:hypothetical protein SAMN05428945_1122 [Streptomyces sp. 2224.1]|uniref:hypothetical protein n=1 Tax=unclassified Streptomyces TaxID=2593676 RepID=UPI0008836767|nr:MULTISPECIES: hypothetical protein [unclassified Streptomyces]PBC84246.1 hypothetical protein BX261_4226 [Streptomyces sp. 2321.6]SDR33316.1 hypothetical protein SAMN05216511_2973 [Streptomyces sp. KS_16]SEB77297.1 hypothetical protein SAMN05428945_1122 [Streptomyces sp. 2224.1]SED24751.1 hypothetical protein SAMN05428940_4253 [Streptomyces sp. 2133.1]SEE57504.1 hypothetical protein SAMN05428954_3052 [Streptomyces sp. 2112.3]
MNCEKCRTLEAELADAVRRGDKTKAVDCRVLLRRHPQHDGGPVESKVPVESVESEGEPWAPRP